jgi:hypothetical protein
VKAATCSACARGLGETWAEIHFCGKAASATPFRLCLDCARRLAVDVGLVELPRLLTRGVNGWDLADLALRALTGRK